MLEDKFHVGLKLSLQVESSYDRINLSLAGWVKGHCIIAAGSKLHEIELTSSSSCVVRFLKDGVAYGFHTTMLSKSFVPLPLIFFRYPKDISSLSFRKSARIKTDIPAMVMGMQGPKGLVSERAKIIDISESGCLLEVPAANFSGVEQGMDLYLTFKIWEESMDLDCSIRNVRQQGDHYLLGTLFKDMPKSSRELIQNFHYMAVVSERDVPSPSGQNS